MFIHGIFTRGRMKWFGVVFVGAALVGWLAVNQILDCLFSFGCDSTNIVGVLAFIVFWPTIVMMNLAESLPGGLANFLGYGWLIAPILAELVYLYFIAIWADKLFRKMKKEPSQ